jgi:phosphatidylserine/phosphatidylglycerophosphate/cardiolipin synthase-like enzyme
VVATGSHNLGHKASYNNDENLLIVAGHRTLAAAYTTHVLDIYDHFAWRYRVNHASQPDNPSLYTNPDQWLTRYYDPTGHITNPQLRFWTQAAI